MSDQPTVKLAPCWICGQPCAHGLCDICSEASDDELDLYLRRLNAQPVQIDVDYEDDDDERTDQQ